MSTDLIKFTTRFYDFQYRSIESFQARKIPQLAAGMIAALGSL